MPPDPKTPEERLEAAHKEALQGWNDVARGGAMKRWRVKYEETHLYEASVVAKTESQAMALVERGMWEGEETFVGMEERTAYEVQEET